ncbi:MAG: hypothetical protein ACE5JZ_08880 [Kiloniellales bacterium]
MRHLVMAAVLGAGTIMTCWTPGSAASLVLAQAGSAAEAADLAHWKRILDSRDPDDFRGYLNKFPDGIFAELARIRLEALGRVDKPAAAAPKPKPPPSRSSAGLAPDHPLKQFDGRYVGRIKRTWFSDFTVRGKCPHRHELSLVIKDGRILEHSKLPLGLELDLKKDRVVAKKGWVKLEAFGGIDEKGRLKDVYADVFFVGLNFIKIYFQGDLAEGTWQNRMRECGGVYKLAREEE